MPNLEYLQKKIHLSNRLQNSKKIIINYYSVLDFETV